MTHMVPEQVRSIRSGDALWLAVSRQGQEWVLDRLIERKSLDDLAGSIRQGRYARQKYFMRRSGIRHLMYIVEGNFDLLTDSWVRLLASACVRVCGQTDD